MSGQDFLDKETRAAVDDLAYRIRDRGDGDIEVLAVDFMIWLRARGWRPTLAVASRNWRDRGPGDAPVPEQGGEGSAAYLALKAARGWGTGPQPAIGTEPKERTE
jgi:hypothetical protein